MRLVALPLLVACSGEGPADPDATEPTEVTYHRDVRPLVDRHCAGCHSEGTSGPSASTPPRKP